MVAVASTLIVDALADGVAGLPEPVPQQGEVTMAEKITPEDLHLDWAQPAVELERVVRLGGAWTTFRGKRLNVLGGCGGGRPSPATAPGRPVRSTERPWRRGPGPSCCERVQPESRSPMSAEEWLRGVRPAVGERLGTD